MLAINQILQERYKIIRQLGHGGMGAVYEAIDERFGEPIALKEIIIELEDDSQKKVINMAFEREAKTLAKAKHETVPFVRDYFSESDKQYLVMELIEGEDLSELLKKYKQPFPLEESVKWLFQLLDALDYLHNLQPPIIHRDIKPQNLKLNSRRRIKLLDFGVARNEDKSAALTRQTFVGATLNYSPIEQIMRVMDSTFREFIVLKHDEKAEVVLQQDTDARCDIYALGATFYHLLTNQIPVDATKRTLSVWEGKPDPLIQPVILNPNIPVGISDCILKAMAIDREDRYYSALEMQEVLKGAVAEADFTYSASLSQDSSSLSAELLNFDLKGGISSREISQPSLSMNSQQQVTVFDENLANSVGKVTDYKTTISSNQPSSSNLTRQTASNIDQPAENIIANEKKDLPKPVNAVKNEQKRGKGLYLTLSAAFISLFVIVGIGSAFWLGAFSSAQSNVQNDSITNVNITESNISPQAVPPAGQVVTPTNENPLTETVTVTPTATPTPKAQTQNPTESGKKNQAEKQNGTKNTKPKQDPNCVFTNSCK